MEEITIEVRPFDDVEVQALVARAVADLAQRYGGDGDQTPIEVGQFDPPLGAFFVASQPGPSGLELVGCAGWRTHGPDAELKRMYVAPAVRGLGLARRLLATVEASAAAAHHPRLILETGTAQPEAIALYLSSGYERIADFGFYRDHPVVRSFARSLTG